MKNISFQDTESLIWLYVLYSYALSYVLLNSCLKFSRIGIREVAHSTIYVLENLSDRSTLLVKLYCTSSTIFIHHTHYEKSDWSRAFNQFTIARELNMINAISAADIAFIMASSTSAWLLSPLECSPQKQNGWTLRFCFWGCEKCIIKQLLNSVFAWNHELSKPRVCPRQITQTLVLISHDIMLNLIQ